MKKLEKRILILFLLIATGVTAQIGIGTRLPHQDAMLEVSSTNKGLLLPRVALTSTTSASPLSSHVAGMSVYNTASTGDVTSGYYYNDGSKWVKLATGIVASVADASTTSNGIVRLAGDLTGSASAPSVANNAITTAKIADGAITASKLNGMTATNGQVLKWNGTAWAPAADAGLTATTVSNAIVSGALTTTVNGVAATAVTLPAPSDASATANGIVRLAGDLAGTAAAPSVANNAITSTKIADGAITATKLNAMSATSGQVLKYNGSTWAPAADAGLTATTVSNTIVSGALTTTVNGVASTAVTLPAPTDASTTSNGIVRLAGDLTGSASAPFIANNAITTVKIADSNVTDTKLAANAVTSAKILDGTIATADIANAAVTMAKINATGTSSATTFLRGDGTWATPSASTPALAVTNPTTDNYTVLETDAIIHRNITANATITFPTSLPAGKVFYIVNTSGSFNWLISPAPLNTSVAQIEAGVGITLVTLGSGQVMVTSAF